MASKNLLVVLHGDKESGLTTPNPGLTEEGKKQIRKNIPLLPYMDSVACGLGQRHIDTAKALGIVPDEWSNFLGSPDSGELNEDGTMEVVLSNGKKVPVTECLDIAIFKKNKVGILSSFKNRTVLVAGRPLMIALGFPEAKSGTLHELTISEAGEITCEEITE